MATQEERYTWVKRHERSNPVNPGRHWVKRHQRSIGFRKEDVKILGVTSQGGNLELLRSQSKPSYFPRSAVTRVKKRMLRDLDYESDVDLQIRPIVRSINQLPETFTTGSCEGHPSLHPDFELPYVMGVSSAKDLNLLVEAASQSRLVFRIEAYLYWEENLPSDMRAWYLTPEEGDSFEEAHRKFIHFRTLLVDQVVVHEPKRTAIYDSAPTRAQ